VGGEVTGPSTNESGVSKVDRRTCEDFRTGFMVDVCILKPLIILSLNI